MKNLYSKSSNLALKLCLILLISFIVLTYSCKKDETTKLHTTEAITNRPEKIDPAEIVNWVQTLPFRLPTDPAWAQASQATINNEFVVKVPVGVDAALFFVKKNGVLQAYTYKWLYEKTDSTGFTGKLDIFNFQTNRLDRLIYKNGNNIKTVTLDNATPAQTPVVQTNQKTNSIDIGRAIAKIWCWLTGGTWYDIWNYGFNCVYPDAGPDYGNETSAGDYYSGIFGNGGIPPVVGGGGGGSSSGGGGGDWVPAPGTGDCGPKVAVVSSGKLRVQLLPPGGGCPPGGGDGTYQPYPIPTPTPQTGDHYDAKFVKSLAIVKITSIINETEAQYQIQLGLTDLEKSQFAAKLFDNYRADFNTGFASLQLNVDDGDDPPFIVWLRGKLRKMLGIDAPKDAVEAQQINNELGAWGTIGQRILVLRDAIRNTLGFVPGFLALDDFNNHEYGSAALNLSLDLFGEGLVKYIGNGITKIGGKYLIKVSELIPKYPNVGNYLKGINITELNILKRSAADKIIILGENMAERVTPSSSLFNKIFKSNIERFSESAAAVAERNILTNNGAIRLTDEQIKNTLSYKENVAWIQQKISQGYSIIDIGIDKSRTSRSPYYMMERSYVYK